jgi:hypothetical protein
MQLLGDYRMIPQKPARDPSKSKPRSFFFTSLPFFIMAHAAHHFLTALPQLLFPAIRDEFKLEGTLLNGGALIFA